MIYIIRQTYLPSVIVVGFVGIVEVRNFLVVISKANLLVVVEVIVEFAVCLA